MHQSGAGVENEERRLAALASYQVLDTEAEPRYDDLTDLAARYFSTPVSLLSLVDRDRLWFKSRVGLDLQELPRERAFCDVCIHEGNLLVVEDLSDDERFADHPLVVGPPHIRFYAGAPLLTSEGLALGTLNVIDFVPRQFSEFDRATLALLARQAVAQMELARQQAMLKQRNCELALHNLTLEQLNRGDDLIEVLHRLVARIEQMYPQMLCTILLVDGERARLIPGAAGALQRILDFPEDGIEIAEGAGSCGTAAFRGDRVVVEDLRTDSLWDGPREKMIAAGLLSCWSQPIKDGNGWVVGSLAIYQREPAAPAPHEIAMLERFANLAALAIERKQVEKRVHQLAFFDALTNLPNRRLIEDRLAQCIAVSGSTGAFYALLFIDLDNFKTINDTLGHAKGDILLQQVALRLLDCVRPEDSVSRLGGDEFVLTLVNLSLDENEAIRMVEEAANTIMTSLNRSYRLHNDYCRCTPSIGATLFRGPDASVDDLLKQADLAMYRSKAAGRNAIHFFDPAMEAKVVERAALETDLRDAFNRQEFILHYQPQVAAGGQLVGAEALMRWLHPSRGMVSPADFIPLAEETGLIVPLGRLALETACAQLARWAAMPDLAHLTLAVNISAHQIKRGDFVEMVLEILGGSGAPADRLKLELTESLLIDNIQDIIEKMVALKAAGVGFSLDDFGTGYSSLSYLKRLPLDQLKIDQSFVRDILSDSNDATIARTIVALAQNLGFGVIAEGVETENQRDFLAQSGCHAYQGYYFSRPLPLDRFEQYCLTRRE